MKRLVLAAALLAVAPPTFAQPAAPESVPRGAFGEVVDVRLIDVEVVVTDRRGNRVSGLARSDFRLLVDGGEVPVAFFDEVRGGRTVAVTAGAAAAGVPGTAPQAAPTASRGTSYLVFIDDFFGRAHHRNSVLRALVSDLEALRPGARVAVVGFDGRRLDVLLPWSGERQQIARSLTSAMKRPAGLAFFEQRRSIRHPETQTRLLARQLERTYDALSNALRSFADASGRRAALVVAGGWPRDISTAFFGVGGQRSLLWRTEEQLQRVADTANSTGYTLYPIDSQGLVSGVPGAGAGRRTAIRFEDGEDLGEQQLLALEAAFNRGPGLDFEVEATLFTLAEETGGLPMINSQRISALERAAADVGDFYWLGFYHQRTGDGERRDVQVVVSGRPELRVRSRRGFVDLSPSAEARFVTERTLLLGGVPDGVARLDVELGRAFAKRGRLELPFSVTIPLNGVTLSPDEEGARVQLELQVAVEDDQGRRSPLAAVPLDLELSEEDVASGEIVYDATVRIRRRPHDLVFTVADVVTGSTQVTRAEFQPSEASR
jgi:VWFA-related protein